MAKHIFEHVQFGLYALRMHVWDPIVQSKVRTVYIEAKFRTFACNAANSLGIILYNKHGVSCEERATVADPEGTRSPPLKHTMQGSTQKN